MKRAVLTVVVALIAVTVLPLAGMTATFVTMDPNAAATARLRCTTENDGVISFEWSAGGFVLENSNDPGSIVIESERGLLSEETQYDFAGLVRLPWGRSAELIVTGGEVVPYNPVFGAGEPVELENAPEAINWATLGSPAVFRDITVAPLHIRGLYREDDGTVWMATRLDVEVRATGHLENVSASRPDHPVSRAFWPVYRSMLLNGLDDLGVDLAATKGTLLLVGNESYFTEMSDFIEWKKQLGYNVEIYSWGGSTPGFAEIRATLANYYETLDPPLEYVMLVGDENRGSSIPSDRIVNPADPNENDVTDWPYAFVEGDDYFPEFFISRLSVGTLSEANNAASRAVTYERDPDFQEVERWEHATLVAANYAEGSLRPLTPVATSQWLRERLIGDWGMSDVDTLFWREGGYQPTSEEISNSINSGTTWITYRGWGDSQGWIQPEYRNADVDNLDNTGTLPIVLSCVCNTGDFGNLNNTKCFAEHWITSGTSNAPNGAVAVIAPSDLHTQTKYNNPLLAGFFKGVYDDGLKNISQALLRAKWELYLGHPNDRDATQSVEFYFCVYHIFGDPTLEMWTKRPEQMTVNIPGSVPLGQDYLPVSIDGYYWDTQEAYVQLRQGENFFAGGYTDEFGTVNLPLTDAQPGEIEVIVSRPDYVPQIMTTQITQQDEYVGVSDWSWQEEMILPGTVVHLDVTFSNSGTVGQDGVTAVMTHPDAERVEVITGTANLGDIPAGSSALSNQLSFRLLEAVPDGSLLEFDVETSGSAGGPWISKIWVPVGAAQLEYAGHEVTSGNYSPGNTASISVSFTNFGSIDAENVTATLVSWDEAVTVTNATVTLGTVPSGETVATQSPFEVAVDAATFGGRPVTYTVLFESGGEQIDVAGMTIPLEGAVSTDPLGPDAYGYFAYDNIDNGFQNMDETVPQYNWYDIENNGGELHNMVDDADFYTELPFDFTFYGVTYPAGTTITISSNGWLDFHEAPNYYRLYFRNWPILGALGPKAMVAGFWDDLKPLLGTYTRVYTYHDADEGLFIIEWHSFNRYLLDTMQYPAVFSIVLKDESVYPTPTGDGVIEIQYNDIADVDADNNGATVGIQNENHTMGLEYAYAQLYPSAAAGIENGRAIRFTTIAPDNFLETPEDSSPTIPAVFKLYGNYPNPFNSTTRIRFDLAARGQTKLTVYNTLGREIVVLLDRTMNAGAHSVAFNAGVLNLPSGIYFIRLETEGGLQAMGKMVYMK